MKRVNYVLTEFQIKRLRELSEKTGLSMSEILRRAIDKYFEESSGPGQAGRGHGGRSSPAGPRPGGKEKGRKGG